MVDHSVALTTSATPGVPPPRPRKKTDVLEQFAL
jgi:hypothetical protein